MISWRDEIVFVARNLHSPLEEILEWSVDEFVAFQKSLVNAMRAERPARR